MTESQSLEGRVIQSFGNRFVVRTAEGTFDCGLRGRLRLSEEKSRTPVAVGDRVAIDVEEPPYGTIAEVFERRNKISRPDVIKPDWEQVLVANCDQLVVVASIVQPRLKYGAIDRFLLAAEQAEMDGVVVINKIDLAKEKALERAASVYRRAGYRVVATSANTGEGLDALREAVRLKTSIFAGHSGVGKSSLLNALEPNLGIRTAEVSEATGKGAHTTTHVQLHQLGFGGYIADMPGIKVIGLWNLHAQDLPELYPEFRPHLGQCRFHNCVHIGEPDCAIKQAVAEETIAKERYEGYLRIRDSLAT